MRTFEYSDARSHKFWNIEVQASTFTVHFGKVGTAGQKSTKNFGDEAAAQAAADKLIREKLGKGYRETTVAASGPQALRSALEAGIVEDPEDRAAHAALADFLMEQGDPQGEFIQVQLALEDETLPAAQRKKLQRREGELRDAHGAEWVGEWATLAHGTGPEGRGQLDFAGPGPSRFIRGIVAEATIDELNLDCARAFVNEPQTRLVRQLFLGGYAYQEPGDYDPGEYDIDAEDEFPARHVLPRWPYFANLRVFQFGWTSNEEYGDFCHFQCHLDDTDVPELVKRMPRLEELYVFASGTGAGKLFGSKTLSHLRVLQVYHNWNYPLEKLAANPALSRLTHLLLHPKAQGAWTAGVEPYITRAGVRAVLRSPHLKNLTQLRLRLTDLGDEGCRDIVLSGILKRLKMLDLRHGCVSDEGARTLAACADLKNLELLELSRNEMTDQGIATLKATGVVVRTEHQHRAGDREYLYEGDYE
jgi:uncharacterized protein (TIGR02996 family)